jgi:hypothetical protein
VGVGLHQALVTVTNNNDVRVEAQSEENWEKFFNSMVQKPQDSRAFERIGFKMPKIQKDNNKTMRLQPAEEVSKQFGVGLKNFEGDDIVIMNRKEESNMFFPVILKVAEVYKALKDGDPHVTKRASGVGSSTGASSASGASLSGNNQQGKEKGKSLQSGSPSKPSTRREDGEDDAKDDEPPGEDSDPPSDSEPSGARKMGLHKFTVKVYAKEGGGFRNVSTIRRNNNIKQQINLASILPTLEIVFFRNEQGEKILEVEAITQCNLRRNVQFNRDHDATNQPYFGWFQDDIMLSFKGTSKDESEKTRLRKPKATHEDHKEPTTAKDIINIAQGVNKIDASQKVWKAMGRFFGFGGDYGESSTNTIARNSSKAHSIETSVDQIEGFNLIKSNERHNLIFEFEIPKSIKYCTNPQKLLGYSHTFTPRIVGEWIVFEDNQCTEAPYTFEVKRNLFHIEKNAITFKRIFLQEYELEMFINLKMTHLNDLPSNKTIAIYQQNLPDAPVQPVVDAPVQPVLDAPEPVRLVLATREQAVKTIIQ